MAILKNIYKAIECDDGESLVAQITNIAQGNIANLKGTAQWDVLRSVFEWSSINCLKELIKSGIEFNETPTYYLQIAMQFYQQNNPLIENKEKHLVMINFIISYFKIDLNEHKMEDCVPFILALALFPQLVELYLKNGFNPEAKFLVPKDTFGNYSDKIMDTVEAFGLFSKSVVREQNQKSLDIIKRYITAKKEREALNQVLPYKKEMGSTATEYSSEKKTDKLKI